MRPLVVDRGLFEWKRYGIQKAVCTRFCLDSSVRCLRKVVFLQVVNKTFVLL